MSSGASEKTEKPTVKRLREEAKKGKSFNSRDLLAAVVLWVGVLVLPMLTGLDAIMELYRDIVGGGFSMTPSAAAGDALVAFAKAVGPVLLIAIVAIALVSVLMSRGVVANEAIRFDLNRINPVNGFKNLFSLKVIKDLLRALLYLVFAALFAWVAFKIWGRDIFSQVHARDNQLAAMWAKVAGSLAAGLLLALAPVYLVAGWLDHVLFIREMKMEKHEVKRESKENEISQEVKQRRREISDELSAQVQADTAGSTLVLANPTHIAIGIYVLDEHSPLPFVSVREKGRRARKVIALAEQSGVPVVRDVRLARSVFAKSKRYRFVNDDDVGRVMQLVRWLADVERAAQISVPPDHRPGGPGA
ncbi:EscU/YscU/HrcU family type III secretion system export apparatus switch protein [Stenotrophomonas indicatrix]|uniref:EscU/YscU/HrcU family type III secretion system export apparatus switch protein n=1 Tax=Stenotrophomonas indicatrix TaxID=2045451 RepID=UPI0030097B64